MQALRAVDVPGLLVAFNREHPHVELRVLHAKGGSLEFAERLRHGELDVAFLSLPERRPPGLEVRVLAEESVELACPGDHVLASRAGVELAELADETFIESPAGWGTRTANDAAFARAGIRRTVRLEVDDVPDLLAMVRAGARHRAVPAVARRRTRRHRARPDPPLRPDLRDLGRDAYDSAPERSRSGAAGRAVT